MPAGAARGTPGSGVAIRGITEQEVVPLGKFARQHGLEMRFIEYVPIGADPWERGKVYFAHEIMEQREREIAPLVPADNYDPRAPAIDFVYTEGGGRIGIIASGSRPFCMSCNRIRLTSDGKLRNGLFALDEVDVKSLFRGGAADETIQEAIRKNVHAKWEGHEINSARFVKPQRTMHAIGAEPYMHDGRYNSLGNVLFFFRGIQRSGSTGLPLDIESLQGVAFKEMTDLLAFLEALSGEEPNNNPPELPKASAPTSSVCRLSQSRFVGTSGWRGVNAGVPGLWLSGVGAIRDPTGEITTEKRPPRRRPAPCNARASSDLAGPPTVWPYMPRPIVASRAIAISRISGT